MKFVIRFTSYLQGVLKRTWMKSLIRNTVVPNISDKGYLKLYYVFIKIRRVHERLISFRAYTNNQVPLRTAREIYFFYEVEKRGRKKRKKKRLIVEFLTFLGNTLALHCYEL